MDISQGLAALYHIGIAYLLALPIGWSQERSSQSAGLRTFPLVSVGACAYMLLGHSMMESEEARARVLHGIVTGIGFVGGGAILKSHETVHGTATAASIWNTGAVGVAVAWDRIDVAVLLAALNFLTLVVLARVKPLIDRHPHEQDSKAVES